MAGTMGVIYVRVPDVLKSDVERAAAKVGVSVNVYVQRVLEKATYNDLSRIKK